MAGSSRVLKFGGTALASPESVRSAVELIGRRSDAETDVVVVVSALAGVTDSLQRVAEVATGDRQVILDTLERVEGRYRALLADVATGPEADRFRDEFERRMGLLRESVRRIGSANGNERALRDEVLSFGERLSVPVVEAALRSAGVEAVARRAHDLLVTNEDYGRARVKWSATRRAVRRELRGRRPVQLIPGFVGASTSSRTTTLGRGGSDLTAVVLGAALEAEEVEIWSDVDGVMTADPRLVPSARTIPSLGWEAMRLLSRYGAQVLQASAVAWAQEAGLPLRIRNAGRPSHPGSWIGPDGHGARPPGPVAVSAGDPQEHRIATADREDRSGDLPPGVVVVGARTMPAIEERLRGALERAAVHVLSVASAPADSLVFGIPARERRRAAAAVHAELFPSAESVERPVRRSRRR